MAARAALWSALLTGCTAAPHSVQPVREVTPIDLNTIASRHEQLDGRWVEFDAYVYRWLGGDFLVAVPGEAVVGPDGTARILCRGTDETNLPVLLGQGYGPLRRRDVRNANRQPRVRIRAMFRDAEFRAPDHWVSGEWRGYFDQARILRVTGQHCDLH